jgi:hypothetical protein
MNSPSKRLGFFSALLVTLALAGSAAALSLFVVIPAGTVVVPSLKTYPQTAADWWKWVLAQPADKNPLLDTTGARCKQGQPGLGVFYLAGSVDGEPVSRKCTVPLGRTLVIPVLNAIAAAFPTDPADQKTEAFLRGQLAGIEDATALSLTIDGVSVSNVSSFFENSVKFSVTLPNNNIYGLPSGQRLDPAYDAGFYVAVSGLLPGKHTIKWHADLGGFIQDVTYDLTVSLLP